MKFQMQVLLLVLVGSFSGCMTNGTANVHKAPVNLSAAASGTSYQLYQTGAAGDTADKCPSGYNVVPNYDWDNDAYHSNYYTVCRNKSDPTQLKVFGVTHDATTVCAIPVNLTGSGASQAYLPFTDSTLTNSDPSLNLLASCFTPTNDGVSISFGNTAFSYLFITTQDDSTQMKECIYNQVYDLCPRYSFGIVN